jgi:hypothetical protein
MRRYRARFVELAVLVTTLVTFALTASADDWKSGQAPVDSVDNIARTITLDGERYRVPTSCRITRGSGVRTSLSTIRVAIRPGMPLVPVNEIDYVRYEAIQRGESWEMVKIEILERAPE